MTPRHLGPARGLTVALVVVLAVAATACGPDDTRAGDAASSRLSAGLKDLKNWKSADWAKWAQQHAFKNDIVKDLWSVDAMNAATPAKPMTATAQSADDRNDPLPPSIPAKAEKHPYTANMAVFGKLFTKSPRVPTSARAP